MPSSPVPPLLSFSSPSFSSALGLSAARRRRRLAAGLALAWLAVAPASAQVNPPNPPNAYPPQVGGEWSDIIVFPHVPVSIANLPDGRVLTFASNEPNSFPGSQNDEYTHAAVFDPETGRITEIPHPNHDMFCAALVMLESGEPFVMGGRNQGNSPWTSYFDYHNDQWVQIENMNRGRWYPTAVYLGNGDVFIAAGVGGGVNPEIWSPDTGWKLLTGIDLSSTILQFGTRDGSGSWPLLQLAPDGTVFHHGATDRMNEIDPFGGPNELGTISDLGPHNRSWFPDEGVSVLYDEGRILVAGGSTATNNNTAVDDAFTIDITTGSPQLQATGAMVYPRQFQNEVVLPTGEVAVIGGNTSGAKFTDSFAVRNAEAWDPDTGTWTEWNAQDQARAYHSTAVLLADGRVFSAGGGLDGDSCAAPEGPGECGDDHWNAEIFSPPYLFASNGQPAARPSIDDAPGVVRVGRTFEVAATPGLSGFSLIRMAANTHTMNTDQRFLRPGVVETSPGTYSLTLHTNENVLVPGYWMLFALDGEVPSVAHVLQVVDDGTPRGAPIPGQRNEVGEDVLLQVRAEDPDGNPLGYSATGLPPGVAIDLITGTIQGSVSQSGVYDVTVTAFDGTEAGLVEFTWVVSSDRSEAGTVTVSQSSAGQWHLVSLGQAFNDPIVVMGPPSTNDAAPVTLRVRNVTSQSFEFQLDEWAYQNGSHGSEDVSYLVVERGEYLLPGGGAVVAGRTPGVDNENPFTQAFPEGAFVTPPVVLAQLASDDGSRAVVVRLQDVTVDGFNLRIQGEEALSQNLPFETVHWIAIEPTSVPDLLDAGLAFPVDDLATPVSFTQGFPSLPHVLATAQTRNGSDTAGLRRDGASTGGVDFFIEEETSGDTETNHADETVGWVAIDPGVDALGLLPLFNEAPVVANPGPRSDANGSSISLFVQATDGDGDSLGFAAAGLPDGLSIDPVTGEISGTLQAPGSYAVTVAATDPSEATGAASFTWTVTDVLEIVPFPTPPARDGETIDYTAGTTLPGSLLFTWDFGDGSPPLGPQASADASHVFATPGRYIVTVTVTDSATSASDEHQFVQNVTGAPTPLAPTRSSSIAYEPANDRVWAVNPDNDTVTAIDAASHAKLAEVAVCGDPRTVDVAGDGRIWVACKDDASLDVVDPATLTVVQTVALPRGSQPHGLVFDPTGSDAYVALESSGEVLRLDGSSGAVLASQAVGQHVRHLAATADGSTLHATRYITAPLPGEETDTVATEIGGVPVGGEVLSLDATTLALGTTAVLAANLLPDSEQSARGFPNYLGAPAISPQGHAMLIPSKQDNLLRGAIRDGQDLTHDSTVRAVTSYVDLGTGQEELLSRLDHDNASVTSATGWSLSGAYAFSTLEGNREVSVVDPYTHFELGRAETGRAPHGVVVSPDGLTLYVDDFMDRTVSVFDLRDLRDYDDADLPRVATVSKVASETLAADVLNGKRLFYDAADPRLALESYMACASCHNDGTHDGRTWDFTQFGEGLRNTIGLRGRGQGHGPVHWTANFDEIQDFEGQIRGFGGGDGLMSDGDFAATSDPLGAPKAGLSADLDDLAAYVASLTTTEDSPHRLPDGSLTPDALAGRALFESEGCADCHLGPAFSDSFLLATHDVGTLNPASSGPQTALDTPTLRRLWFTAPFLHDGSAPTIGDAVDRHAGVSLAPAELDSLVAYLEQLDDAEAGAPGGGPVGLVGAWAFDEPAGTLLIDASGNGRDGTLENGATRNASGFFNGAVEVDGSAGNADLGSFDIPGDQLTLMAWFNADDFGVKDGRFVSKSTGEDEQDHWWMLSTRRGKFLRFRLKAGGTTTTLVEDADRLPTGTWVHAAVTYDGATMRIYRDGALTGSTAKTGAIDAAPGVTAWVGANPGHPGQVFDGRIDEVKIFARALDAAEIQAEMNAPLVVEEDTEAPSAPAFASATAIGSDAIQVDWGAATDNVAVTEYHVYRDGGLVGTTSGLSLVDAPLGSGETHSYTVTAQDAQGNEGPAAGPAQATTPTPDLQAPDPPPGVTATALSATQVELSWGEASDDVAVVAYAVYRDGGLIAALDADARSHVDATAQPATSYDYAVTALDLAGNESDPAATLRTVETPDGTADLVAAWGFDEPSGAVFLDGSGNGRDGVIENGATRSGSGHSGGAVELDGVAGNGDVGSLDVPGSEITLMAWFNADDFGVKDARFVSKSTGEEEQDHWWMLSTRRGKFLRFRLKAGGTTTTLVEDASRLSSGTWVHAAATYDGTTMRIYRDGALTGSAAKTGAIDQAPGVAAWIGANPGHPGQVFDGRIDDVKIFSRALTPGEIQAEMTLPAPTP